MSLMDEVIEAHGGLNRWRQASAVRLRVSSGGLAFASKGQRTALHDLTATVSTRGQAVTLEAATWSFRFGSLMPKPRGLRWSTEEVAAFAACALWTYVSLPFVLAELDVEERGNQLVVHFPPQLRTHSPTQVLHIDEERLIRRHDYTALDFGRLARASQEVGEYRQFGGIAIATRRRVRPSLWPHRPLLVWIDVHSVDVIPGFSRRGPGSGRVTVPPNDGSSEWASGADIAPDLHREPQKPPQLAVSTRRTEALNKCTTPVRETPLRG